jgi:uncharacterized damage-inducible protein DinB
MDSTMTTDLRYPIGTFTFTTLPTREQIAGWIDDIAATPSAVRAAIDGLDAKQIETPYRPEGWTVRQVVHHIADSHLNAYTRFKLALTEDTPTIKPYDEAAWANLADTTIVPLSVSLDLLEALHIRWVALLRSLSPDDLERDFRHPEKGRIMRLDSTLGLYSWHGKHHVAHITALREREGW